MRTILEPTIPAGESALASPGIDRRRLDLRGAFISPLLYFLWHLLPLLTGRQRN